jgi:CHASE2 domain-containing sensor protein
MKKIFKWDNVFATATIFFTMWLLSQVAISVDFLNVFDKALSDYEVTDIVFSKFKDRRTDERIVLVNIGQADRATIAAQLDTINKYNPRVVGIDVEFRVDGDHIQDSLLASAMENTKNLVLWSKVEQGRQDSTTGEVTWDTLLYINPKFTQYGKTGFVNSITENFSPFEMWRETTAIEKLTDGREERSFAAQIAMIYDSTKGKTFIDRYRRRPVDDKAESINFTGNLEVFTKLDVADVLDGNFDPEIIKDKIVLFGYLGSEYTNPYWDEDKYYSPMNEVQIGRTPPDMYGVVVHANIIAMILSNNYINHMPDWFAWVVAIVMCFLNVTLFSWISHHERLSLLYDLISKLTQLLQSLALFYIILVVFADYNIKLDLTTTLAAIVLSGDIYEIYSSIKESFSRKK